ncbi:MAG: hypothetical protein AAGA61_02685 [Pseudomonadota bacterium]
MTLRYLTCLLLLVAVRSLAHGAADNHLQIMVIDNRIKMNIVVDMRVLDRVDADEDGYASLDELAAQSPAIQSWVRETLTVADNMGNAGQVVFADITSDLHIAGANGDRVDHARIVQTLTFPAAVNELQLDLGDLARLVPELRVTIIDAKTGLQYRLRDPSIAQSITLPG